MKTRTQLKKEIYGLLNELRENSANLEKASDLREMASRLERVRTLTAKMVAKEMISIVRRMHEETLRG